MNRSEITLDLHGKVAIVTGAAQGIGRAIAMLFAAQGARVVVADILEDKSRAVVELIAQAGGTALALTTDVSKPEQIRQTVAATVAQWGRVDIVVNNAYWSAHGTVVDLDENSWERSMVKAIYLFGKYTFPLMIDQGAAIW